MPISKNPDQSRLKKFSGSAPKVLITGGATCEDIDPVRYITNRSTGRMGAELARAAMKMGIEPLLLLGENAVKEPRGCKTIRFRSAQDLLEKMQSSFSWCDGVIMTAAVADYTPREYVPTKIHKIEGDLVWRLKRTPDILHVLSQDPIRPQKRICGFSLDTVMDIDQGRNKLKKKKLDLLVVNTTASFAGATMTATMLTPESVIPLGDNLKKSQVARAILQHLFP